MVLEQQRLGNQQPSREQRKVQRLSRKGVHGKRLAVEVVYILCLSIKKEVEVGRFTMDCLLMIEGIKIDVEYDGIYWHQSRHHYDVWRDQKMFANGYKVLRIVSKGKMPTFEQIIEAVDKLKTKQENLVKLNIE